MRIQNVKGCYDFLPKEQKIRNYINNILITTFEEYGFNSIETSILCYYDILSDKYDEQSDILKEIYKLSDQGDRKLGLRYDLTVPFAKFIALNKNNIKFPFKRYEISKVFRDGPIKRGRDREFTQCDADVVGIEGQLIEAELLTLFVKAFNKLNIDITIKYNSRNLMIGLIIESGINKDKVSEVTTIIDKMNKISENEFDKYLLDMDIDLNNINKLKEYLRMNIDDLKLELNNTCNKYVLKGIEEISNLKNYIINLEIDDICVFDSTLARGQNYYTGNVFEVYEKNNKINGSIGAGGRYDNMIKNFIDDKEEYPTVGISFGLSSIYELIKDRELFDDCSNIDIYIIPLGTEIECLKIANNLRDYGLKVEIEMNNKKLKKSLDYANKEKIPGVIIIGEDEIKNNKVKVKDMFNNKDIEIGLNELEKIREII